MRTFFSALLVLTAAAIFFRAGPVRPENEFTPAEILASAALLPSGTLTAEAEGTRYSSGGKVRVFAMTMMRKTSGSVDKILYRVSSPQDVAGNALLSVTTGTDAAPQTRRWFYEAGKGRTEELDLQQARKDFLDTDFTFEDLDRRYPEFPELALLGRPVLDGASAWLIEAHPAEKKEKSDKMRFWVRIKEPILVKSALFDKKERVLKTYRAGNIGKTGETRLAAKWEMKDDRGGSYTIINLKNIQYGVEIDDSAFNADNLGKP